MILAGDIGGTKVNLGLFREEDGSLFLEESASFKSGEYAGLEEILAEFCARTGHAARRACFGIAGPVREGKCRLTNLPWEADAEALKSQLQAEEVWLINDLAAMACGVPFLDETDVVVLQKGEPDPRGRIAVIAAGTGLGQAFLVPDGEGRYIIVDCEGGHCDFPPRDRTESRLLRFMLGQFERVSLERVLSGPGLHQIYRFVVQDEPVVEPEWLSREFRESDPGSAVAAHGLRKTFPACEKALALFVSIYGAAAGNLALQVMARGGVFVGGGIAPKIAPAIEGGRFMEAFLSKGRFRPFMTQVPVKMILNDRVSLLGAAHFAMGARFRR
ncbi:MAG: glucokinase [Nitrospinae bacterium]|nr:glucokinase [Nitrospinota bacterium]